MAWEEIAAAVGAAVEDCKNRWRLLRDQFVKNSKKDMPSGSAAGSHPPSYKYAEIMCFLRPHIQHRSTKSSLCNATPAASTSHSASPVVQSTTVRPITPASDVDTKRMQTPSSPSTALSPAPSGSTVKRGVERSDRSRSPRERVAARPAQEVRRRTRSPPQQQEQEPDFRERLLSVLQEAPVKPPVPDTQKDELYLFVLSLIPMMLRLSDGGIRRAKLDILKTLHQIQDEESRHTSGGSPHVPLLPQQTPPTSRPLAPRPGSVQAEFHPTPTPQPTGTIGPFTEMQSDGSQWEEQYADF